MQLHQPGSRWRRTNSPEHEAWWMPKEWAQERGIGAYRSDMACEENERQARKRVHQIPRNNSNVEKIRTGNFIRL